MKHWIAASLLIATLVKELQEAASGAGASVALARTGLVMARGAGPLRQPVTGRVKARFVLVGDAAGYVDAITGEGLFSAAMSFA